MKYRVLAEYLTDGHFKPLDPKVLFKSDDIDKCYDFVDEYNEKNRDAWVKLHVQEFVTRVIRGYEDV